MIQLFKQISKLNVAISVNGLVYYLRQIPLLKKIVPGYTYGNDELNNVVHVFSYLVLGARELFFHLLFLLCFIVFPGVNAGWTGDSNMMVFVFYITLFSAFFNDSLLKVSEEMYYGVVLLKVNVTDYVMMAFTKLLIKKSVINFIFLLLLSFIMGFEWYYCLIYPLFYVTLKIIVGYILVKLFEKTEVIYSEKNTLVVGAALLMVLVIAAVIFVKSMFGLYIPDRAFILFGCILVPIAYVCYTKLLKTNSFKAAFRGRLVWEKLILNVKESETEIQVAASKSLELGKEIQIQKDGYAYFNALFFQRHRKILFKSSLRFALIQLGLSVVAFGVVYFIPELKADVYNLIQWQMPGFLIGMYYLNRGGKVVQAMFVNCDRSMLNYRFYRARETVLLVFVERLKVLAYVNLIPSLILSLGICALFGLSRPSAEWYYYVLIFASINSISLFFSVHHLVLYYLLQPYDESLSMKGYWYHIIHGVTYFVCYQALRFQVELFKFTVMTTLFSLVYIGIALILVFRYAPKTFKIKK